MPEQPIIEKRKTFVKHNVFIVLVYRQVIMINICLGGLNFMSAVHAYMEGKAIRTFGTERP